MFLSGGRRMAFFSDFCTTDDMALNLYHALQFCAENNESSLIFEKGSYFFTPEMASEDVLHISNHDVYGITRIAFLLKNLKNFTIDGGGSTFMFHGILTPFAVRFCENITIKNLTIDYDDVMLLEMKVTKVGKGYFDAKVTNSSGYELQGENFYYTNGEGIRDPFFYFMIRSRDGQQEFAPAANDYYSVNNSALYFGEGEDGAIRIFGSGAEERLCVGMNIISRGRLRYGCNFFCERSKDLRLENVTMYKSLAMGVLAQKCENVSIDRMVVKAGEGCLCSLNADATHFVNCKGLVKVTNSEFSEQLDDALNVHGEFNPIVGKTEEYVLIKYVHESAKGLEIYEKGDRIAVLAPKTLISKMECVVERAEVINLNYTKLYLQGGTQGIQIGDVVEDLTWNCDLIFQKNRVTNNRARGLLIATKGKVQICDNYFCTPGISIKFESDGRYWFEAGGTTDVEISGNVFEHCNFTHSWGRGVILVSPREEFHDGEFYHQKISVTDNRFLKNCTELMYIDNVKEYTFLQNEVQDYTPEMLGSVKNCGTVTMDLPESL